MIDSLVKKKIPIPKGEELEEREVGFYFGVIILKYIKSDMGMEITELIKTFKDMKTNISEGFSSAVKFLFCAHKSWMAIQNKEPEISETSLWFAFDQLKRTEFLALFSSGLEKLTNSMNDEDENPKVPSPKS